MKVMSMMTARKWRSEPRIAGGLRFWDFLPHKEKSVRDLHTMAQFRIFIFSCKTVPIDLKVTGFTARYFGLAGDGLLRFCFCMFLRYLTECDAAEISVRCAGRGQQNRSKRPLAWSV